MSRSQHNDPQSVQQHKRENHKHPSAPDKLMGGAQGFVQNRLRCFWFEHQDDPAPVPFHLVDRMARSLPQLILSSTVCV
jgi:hypothetical protein